MTEEQLADLIAEHVTISYQLGEGGNADPSTIRIHALGAAHVVMHKLAAPDMLAALQDAVAHCYACGGGGIAYTMPDETEIDQPLGSSGIDCPGCTKQRAAIAKATEPPK